MTSYLVTGGAGFIGSHIAERLLKEGHHVRIVDNLLTGKAGNLAYLKSLNADLEIYETSITDFASLPPIFEGVEIVFHEAALASVPRSVADPLSTHANCATGTLHVLKAAQETGVRRVVYAASSSAYGDQDGDFKHEGMKPKPISPYAVAKLAAEQYCQVFYQVYGLETVALRYFNVFGARQDPASEYAAVIPKFITRILQGQSPIIYGDGSQSRDFTYIDNVVHGNLLAASAPDAAGEVMNLAMGGNVSLLELVEKINNNLGTNISAEHAPVRTGDILHSQASIQKAMDLLDFAPIVSFDEGLRRTIDWYKSSLKI